MNKKQAIGLSVIGALALTFLLLAVTGANAEPGVPQADVVPGTISYQGRLLDEGGNPVNGSPIITFSLYAQSIGGSPLWQEAFDVPVQDGLFHVTLALNPTLFDGRALWLGVRVEGDPVELSPRQQLLPTPYALSLRPGALVSASLPGAPVLRLVNASSGQALSLYARAESALWAISDAPFPAIYAENSAASPGLRGDSAFGSGVLGMGLTSGVKGQSSSGSGVEGVSDSGSGVAGHSSTGPGGTFTSTTGAGLFASSDAGHALVTERPSLIQGPNPQQIALLKWYPAIQTPMSFTVGMGPYAVAFDGANVWVACDDSTVHVLRANSGALVMTATIGVWPQGLAFDGTNMWIVSMWDDRVDVLRAADGSHVMTPTIGNSPVAIAFDGANMWVVNAGDNTVSVLRAGDGFHVMTLTVGAYPSGIAFDGANVWVTNGSDDTVSVLRTSDGFHVMTPTVGAGPSAIAFDGANMWVTNYGDGTVSVLRAGDGSLVMTPAVGTNPHAIAFDGANMWVTNYLDGTVSVLRASDGSLVMTLDVGNVPWGIAFDGANMWVANYGDNTVSKR